MDFNDYAGRSTFPRRRARVAEEERTDRSRTRRARLHRQSEAVAEAQVRRRLGVSALAQGIRRPRRERDRAGDLGSGRGQVRNAAEHVPDRPGHGGADADGVRDRRAEETLPAEARERRRDLVSALQRTGRRLGPRGVAHAFGEARRRMGRQRPEDLDVRRALQRLGHSGDPLRSDRAEAQGPHVLLPEHEEPRRNE